jgi:biopolymer transport protein ExbD
MLEGNRGLTWWGGLGGFHGTHGHYLLSLDLLDDASILGFRESSLRVFENGGKQGLSSDLGSIGLFACFLCVPVSICSIIQSAIVRRQERYGELLRSHILDPIGPVDLKGSGVPAVCGVSRAPFLSRRKAVRSVRPWSPMQASTHSLILATAYSTLLSILCVAQSLDHQIPTGLRVRVVRPGVVTLRGPGLQPVLVRVASDGLFVDSQPVSRRDLGAVLRRELDRRPPNWPVYFKGDSQKDFQYSSDAIDAIREQGAEVILLTRKSWSQH